MNLTPDQIIGTHINYYFVCKRKLWLFSRGIHMEQNNDRVSLGRIVDEKSYSKEEKHIAIDSRIVIDYIDKKKKILHEIKLTNAMEEAHLWQMRYYLFILEEHGIYHFTGEINYPTIKQKSKVTFDDNSRLEMVKIIEDSCTVVNNKMIPNKIEFKFCKKCAYFELCWV